MNRWGTHGNYKRPSKRRGLDNGFNSGHRKGRKVEDIFTRKVNKIFRLFFQMKSIGFCLNKREKSQTAWFWGVKQLGKGNVKNRRSKAFCLFVCFCLVHVKVEMLFGFPCCNTVKRTFGWMDLDFWRHIKARDVDLAVTYRRGPT